MSFMPLSECGFCSYRNSTIMKSKQRGSLRSTSGMLGVVGVVVNTVNGYVQEVCPVSKPLKRESKARAAGG